MSGTPVREAVEAARQVVARRWQAIDPLLPEPGEPTKTCGTDLTVTSADGRIGATGYCRHVHLRPESLELAWGAASQFALTPWVAGPDIGDGLGQLLERWRSHLIRQQDAADGDSEATVRWPSRDVSGVRVLLEHGLRRSRSSQHGRRTGPSMAARPAQARPACASAGPEKATWMVLNG